MNWLFAENLDNLPKKGSTPYMGWVYAFEYGDDLKIGCTTNLKERINTLRHQAEVYGNKKVGVLVHSKEHTNYRDNERFLHHHFENYRKGSSELFHISLPDFLKNIPHMDFLDDSVKIESEADKILNTLKGHIDTELDMLKRLNTLTTDDYIKAAELIADCDDEMFHFVLDLLKSRGFKTLE